MFYIISHWRTADQNHNDMSFHTYQAAYNNDEKGKKQKIIMYY